MAPFFVTEAAKPNLNLNEKFKKAVFSNVLGLPLNILLISFLWFCITFLWVNVTQKEFIFHRFWYFRNYPFSIFLNIMIFRNLINFVIS